MHESKDICPTKLLDDTPAREDAFGPHRRVALALVSMIKNERGGKVVGLEGGWGAGKTTVVRFVCDALERDKNYRIVTFDAWAHEGDPLRRTYLETVISNLQEAGWLRRKHWDILVAKLTNRCRITKKRTTPKATTLGIAFAISILLLPLGVALLGTALQDGIRQGIDENLAEVVLGGVFALAPFIVILLNGIFVVSKWIGRILNIGSKSNKDSEVSDWAFLYSRTIEETQSETTETPDPTSIEFEDYFTKSMREALDSTPERRILIVLDNLDRVEHKTALAVWSTLQTFVQERDRGIHPWFEQLWYIVPYDSRGLRALWENRGESTGNDVHNLVSNSFMDKSFQIRFEVPRPVLSNWKSYLYGIIGEALPRHAQDRHILYRVYEQWRRKQPAPPTPRELKLYVNQVGALHRQWQHHFPLGHVGYYVLKRGETDTLVADLLDGKIPSEEDIMMLGKQLTESTAGLTFGVDPEKGMEMLLADPIAECLITANGEELLKLKNSHQDGFWPVLEIVVTSQLPGVTPREKCQSGRCLLRADIASNRDIPEVRTVFESLHTMIKATDQWSPWQDEMAGGIIAFMELFADAQFSKKILESVGSTFSAIELSDKEVTDSTNIEPLLSIFESAVNLGHEAEIPQTVVVPGAPEVWFTTCEILASKESYRRFWSIIRPSKPVDTIEKHINKAIDEAKFDNRHIATIRVMSSAQDVPISVALFEGIQRQLDASMNRSDEEVWFLLRGLWALRQMGDEETRSRIDGWIMQGHVAHHLHSVRKFAKGKALCLLTLLRADPRLKQRQNVGQSTNGYKSADNALQSPNSELAGAMFRILREYGELHELWRIVDVRKAYDPLIASCLRKVAEADRPEEFFTNEEVGKRWNEIKSAIEADDVPDRFIALIGHLSQVQDLPGFLIRSEHDVFVENAGLYDAIVGQYGSVDREFVRWCRERTEGMSREDWLADFGESYACVQLSLTLQDSGESPSLTTPVADSLLEHFGEITKETNLPDVSLIERWQDFLELIKPSVRKTLAGALLASLIVQDGEFSTEMLTLYPEETRSKELLLENGKSVGWFSAIVRQSNIVGLRWLVDFFSKHPTFLEEATERMDVDEFITRVHDSVVHSKEGEAQPLLSTLASIIGVALDSTERDGDIEREADATGDRSSA